MSGAAAFGAGVAVTGATGFFGSRLVQTLRGRGVRVRALARPTSDTRRIAALGAEVVRGDVTNPQSLAGAFAGQELVIHAAAKVADWGPREEFFRVNAQGTANVVAACRAAGVRRLVHLGSLTVLGLPRDGRLVDESEPPAAAPRDAYSASKLSAERVVRAGHGDGLETVVIRCGVIWGPNEPTILPRVAALLRRGWMVYPGGGGNSVGLTHVDNLVAGVLLGASVPAAAGGLYHVTDGEEVTCRELIDALAGALGAPPPRRSVPFAALYALATLLELSARAARKPSAPLLTRYGVRLLACDSRYDVGKAVRELGYRPPVSLRRGVDDVGKAARAAGAR